MLSKDDSITIEHLGKEYIIDIIDTKPEDVVVIVETDVAVDIEYAEVYLMLLLLLYHLEKNGKLWFEKTQKGWISRLSL